MKNAFFALFLLFPALIFSSQADCKVYFSPNDPLAERLIELIDKEEKSVKVAIYCMTHVGIAKALINAQERGVNVEVLVDPFSIKKRSSIHRLINAKVPLLVWDKDIQLSLRKGHRLMHDKFCIFGDRLVWTGSFNFTLNAAKRHQENAVVIDSKEITHQYAKAFEKMKLYESRSYKEYLALHPKKERAKKPGSRYAGVGSTEVKK